MTTTRDERIEAEVRRIVALPVDEQLAEIECLRTHELEVLLYCSCRCV
jgi:hypothetical protein